jgi:hypothetical protein
MASMIVDELMNLKTEETVTEENKEKKLRESINDLLRPDDGIMEELNAITIKLMKQVDDDWHDGWQEQGETFDEWLELLKCPLQTVLHVGIRNGIMLKECNEVLKIISHSWRNIYNTNMRCFEQQFDGDWDVDFSPPDGKDVIAGHEYVYSISLLYDFQKKRKDRYCIVMNVMEFVWNLLLRKHVSMVNANNTDVLLQCIKDCDSNDFSLGLYEGEMDEEYKRNNNIEEEYKDITDNLQLTSSDLKGLEKYVEENKSKWKVLPDTRTNLRPDPFKQPATYGDDDRVPYWEHEEMQYVHPSWLDGTPAEFVELNNRCKGMKTKRELKEMLGYYRSKNDMLIYG